MTEFFHSVIFLPIYNLLVFLVDTIPGEDLGLAVIIVTIIVKLLLMPLSLEAAKTQKAMRAIEPQLKALREKHKEDKERQAKEMFALYKTHHIKPFSSILLLFIQLPIVFGLYFVCKSIETAIVDPSFLYGFVPNPESLSPLFLGIFLVSGPSVVLAILAGLSQLAQAWFLIPIPPKSTSATPTLQEEFGRNIAIQARFMLPIIIGIFAYTSGAIALYFIASSLFMIVQELIVRRIHKAPKLVAA